jgi:hypothetical protein
MAKKGFLLGQPGLYNRRPRRGPNMGHLSLLVILVYHSSQIIQEGEEFLGI